jgi:membrane-associated phospholipid phosphatase
MRTEAAVLGDRQQRVNAVDILNFSAILLLTIAVAVWRRELGDDALRLAGVSASLLLFTLSCIWLAGSHPRWRVVHDFSPILTVVVIFNSLGPLIESVRPERWDATFAALDALLFGSLPDLWRGILGRPAWCTDLAYLAYSTYYLAPVVLAGIIYRRQPVENFRCLVFTILLGLYLSFLGYFIFPTLGPRPPAGSEAAVVGGGMVSQSIRAFINFAERNRTDAFPSGHTAVALICLYFARRLSPPLLAAFAVVVAGIVLSTVYLHYHYVFDVVAGAVLALVCVRLGPPLAAILEPREIMKRLTLRSDAGIR